MSCFALQAFVLALAQSGSELAGDPTAALAEARDALMRAQSAEAARDNEGARLEVRAGLAALEGWDERREAEALNFALAGAARRTGDTESARLGWERSRAWREAHLQPDDPLLQEIRTNVAVLMKEAGDLEGARALEEQVLEVCECRLPEGDSFRMAARNNLALTLWGLHDLVGARLLLERELAVRERLLPPEDPRILTELGNLAIVLSDMGDQSAARIVFERVIDSLQRRLARPELFAFGGPAPSSGGVKNQIERQIAAARLGLSAVVSRAGDPWAALEQSELALAWFEEHASRGEIDFVQARMSVAYGLAALGMGGRARQLLALAAEDAARTQQPGSLVLVGLEAYEIESLMARGEFADALRRARELRDGLLRDGHAGSQWERVSSLICLQAAMEAGERELAPEIEHAIAVADRLLYSGLSSSTREASSPPPCWPATAPRGGWSNA